MNVALHFMEADGKRASLKGLALMPEPFAGGNQGRGKYHNGFASLLAF
jgi:hypothetical protein